MKQIIYMFVLIFIGGCSQNVNIMKVPEPVKEEVHEGTFSSQVGAPALMQVEIEKLRYFVEPPLKIEKASVSQALDLVFLRAGAKYKIDSPVLDRTGKIDLIITKRKSLEDVLSEILSPRSGRFEIDSKNIYHIKADVIPVDKP